MRARVRFFASWALAIALLTIGLPRAVDVSWHGVMPVLRSIHWPAAVALVGLWLLGLWVHSFVLTAAAPSLTHRRALTLNVTGSAVSNVLPLGGAAGVELNRRMMKAWGIDTRDFTGYTFLTNLWDVGAKLLLPVLAVLALAHADEVTGQLRAAAILAGVCFVGLAAVATALLASPHAAQVVGGFVERLASRALRLIHRDREIHVVETLLEVRRECVGLVVRGWLRMSLGISGYLALQAVLLGACLHLTSAGCSWAEVLAAFAVERLFTVVPITPGGVGIADLGLVGTLLALGGDPAGVTAAAVLYRLFIFAVEIPVGGSALGVWLLGQRLTERRAPVLMRAPGPARRIAHVTDVFLPRLGGIETHVDELVRQQRSRGLDAEVLTPPRPCEGDPGWVHRLPAAQARRVVRDYDVVHVHVSMLSPYGIAVARAAMAAGIPTLVTVHSMWAGAGGILRVAALAGLRRWPVAWSAVSSAAAETFGRSLQGITVEVLPNAVDVAAWRPALRDVAEPDDDRPVTLVSVMRLMPRKRPLQLLRMLRRVRELTPEVDVRLVIVGDGPLRRRTERYVRRHGLAEHVRITGRIPRERVIDELLASTIYVAPAAKESFGLAALEARCAGLPVVAHRSSGVAEFVRDRVDGVLAADDVEMTVAVADLVRDASLRNRIADHNRRVAPAFDWTDSLDRTQALYRAAAARVAPAADAPASLVPSALAIEG
ncbi:hypothetical protein JCM18899A_45980 [Nocardioides sp. AN3]